VTLVERASDVLRDGRYVLRTLRRAPAFTLGVVGTFALGLGLNTAVFRVADQALIRPPAGVRDAAAVRRVETLPSAGMRSPLRASLFSFPDADAVAASGAFQSVALQGPPRLMAGADGRDISVSSIDDRFFALLGVPVRAGRGFDAAEARPGSGIAVAVVSHEFWTRRLGSPPVDGSASVSAGGTRYGLIGVLPPRFTGIDLDPVDVWLPLGASTFGHGWVNGVDIPWYQSDMLRALRILGRPAPGVTSSALDDRLSSVLRGRDEANAAQPRRAASPSIVPAGESAAVEGARRLLGRLGGVAFLVLLIACANVVNLLLARSLLRSHEIAVRLALGASRARLFRLVIVESMMLAALGGAAGMLAGVWTADALRRLAFPDSRWTLSLLDGRTLVFTAVLTLVAGLAAGIAPAAQATGTDLLGALKDGLDRGGARLRAARAVLVVVQIALSSAMLIAAGLLVLSLVRLNAVAIGFDPRGLVTASLSTLSFDARPDAAETASRLQTGGEVQGVALATGAPFGAMAMRSFTIPGSSFAPETYRDQSLFMAVSPGYFSVMGTRVLRGRAFTAADVRGAEPVAVVNESMARRYWGTSVPDGACVLMTPAPCYRVVGIVEDARDTPGGDAAWMRYYLPLDQQSLPPSAIVVRTAANDVGRVAAALRAAAPAGQRVTVDVVADRVARATRPWRTSTLLFAALAAVALLLASIGVHSLMTYLVSERRYELGVRVALGASSHDLIVLVLGTALRLTLVGAVAGLVVAAAAGRLLQTLLFAVSAFEPGVYAAGMACLAAAGLLAALPPALRAARLNPLAALRRD
jgi:predicted permease